LITPLEMTKSTLPSGEGECFDAALAELDLCQSGLVGEPTRLVQLLWGEVDAVHPPGGSDQARSVEGVHP